MFTQSYYVYLIRYYFGKGGLLVSLPTILTYIPMAILMAFVQRLARRRGKKELTAAGMAVAALANFAMFFLHYLPAERALWPFMALCLLTTLRAIAREHAPGLTPRQIIDKMKTVKMVDVVMPTTDGRVVTLPRYVEPKEDVALLIGALGLTLPAQPPPKISGNAVLQETEV
jgi:hypothetical protein